jgi:hypothetical protein
MYFVTALRATLARALPQPQHQPPQPSPLLSPPHRHLLHLLQRMAKAQHRRQVLELSQLAALLPLDEQARTLLVEQTLEALARVESMPSPRSSASRAQMVRSIRSRRRRR